MTTIVADSTLAVLRGKLRTIMNDRSDQILDGGCDTFEEYRHGVGVLYGLALAERELLDLDKKMRDDEDF